MDASLLQTKLYIPPTRPELVPRPRLIEGLNEGLHRKLTLVSAPAGFGKTTLVSDWLRQIDLPAAWLSLDESDNDLTRFLTYFIAALQQIDADIGQTVQDIVRSPQLPPPEVLMTTLINDLAAFPKKFVFVLDDYHVINAQTIHEPLTFFLEHIPPQMHLIITGRADPPLPLSRLQARGQMTEIRADDLRFTTEEATAFLNEISRLALSGEDVTALAARTEGWIAGLQLAAISMQGQDAMRTSSFIAAFAGDDRYIFDYLADEVLQQRPQGTQEFLLQTSILDRLCGPLCDAVTGQGNGQTTLERLEAANLFIVPLDNKRYWYRYHLLFADLLRQNLHQNPPSLSPPVEGTKGRAVAELHRRAGQWFEQEGLIDEAVGHAMAAEDFERATRLIERHAQTKFWIQGEGLELQGWLQALPVTMVRSRPRLCLTYAWILFLTGQRDRIETWLQAAESALEVKAVSNASFPTPEGDSLAAAAAEIQSMLGEVDAIRAFLARYRGDTAQALKLCRLALERLSEDSLTIRSLATINLAHVHFSLGDMVAASQAYTEGIVLSRAAEAAFVLLFTTAHLIQVLAMRGQLQQANRQFRELEDKWLKGKPYGPTVSLAYANIGMVHREWNDLDSAATYLKQGLELSRPFRSSLNFYLFLAYVSLALVLQAQGEVDQAFDTLQVMEQPGEDGQRLYPAAGVAAGRARLWMAEGNVAAAVRWARESGLSVSDELSYSREFEYLTLARVLIVQSKLDEALSLLERLSQTTQTGGRMGRVIEILILQALAHQAQDDMAQALTTLEQALSLAEPEGYVRIFVDEGEPMAVLLREAATQGIKPDYANQLLAAFLAETQRDRGAGEKKKYGPSPSLPPSSAPPLLTESLTERELDTLRFLATELTIPEIAEEMVVAVSTTRSHVKSIYSKLNVHSRLQAIQRAKDLGLL